jgi:hypothetical protein
MSLLYNANGAVGVFPTKPTVTSYYPINNGNLVAYFEVLFPGGIKLCDLVLFKRDNQRWISTPSREINRKNGKNEYRDVIVFTTTECRSQF